MVARHRLCTAHTHTHTHTSLTAPSVTGSSQAHVLVSSQQPRPFAPALAFAGLGQTLQAQSGERVNAVTCLHRHARLSPRTFCAALTACGTPQLLLLSPLTVLFHLPLPIALGSPHSPASEEDKKKRDHLLIRFSVFGPIPRMKLTQQGALADLHDSLTT